MQMFLHQHACNAARSRDGLLPINSLWCWGDGRATGRARPARWYCDDTLLSRWARHFELEVASLETFATPIPEYRLHTHQVFVKRCTAGMIQNGWNVFHHVGP